jgi:hypothetical protein
MPKTLVHKRTRRLLFAIAIAAPWSLGCASSDFGSDLAARPRPRSLPAEKTTVRLPADMAFSIALSPSNENPGLGGQAEADSHATPDGKADAAASVNNGGDATASFQLGHAFSNDTSRQMDLSFKLRYHYDFDAEVPDPRVPVEGGIGLMLYARDNRNRLTRSDQLLNHTLDDGAIERSGSDATSFVLTLGPGESVSVFVAGRVYVKASEERSAKCSMNLTGVEMEVQTTPAQPVRSASDEQR